MFVVQLYYAMSTRNLSRILLQSAFTLLFIAVSNFASSQKLERLTVEKIMRDPMWIGTSPSSPYWSRDGKKLFFRWNPDKKISDSVYYITKDSLQPKKASYALRQATLSASAVNYNTLRTAYTYTKFDDVFLADVKTGDERRITKTADVESNADFIENDTKVGFSRNQNLYSWDISTGLITQLTNFRSGAAPPKEERKEVLNAQETWLKNDQLMNMEVLRTRKQKRDSTEAAAKALPKEKQLKPSIMKIKF